MKKTGNVIVVGGGMAGLTATTYLAKAGIPVTLFEKGPQTGGLVNSFERNGFTYDGGIRSLEDSGILFTMLKDLKIDMEWVDSKVSIGLGQDVIKLKDESSLDDYEAFLKRNFPNTHDEIDQIMLVIKKIMSYMDVLYGIENPIFMDMSADPKYMRKVFLPWFIKYLGTVNKILKMNQPVELYLENFSKDRQLNDNITQHFFKHTPAFFALSYFSLYLDYHYPIGGTGMLPKKIDELARKLGADIKLNTGIDVLDIENKLVIDCHGEKHNYDKLIWAADLRTMYRSIPVDKLKKNKTIKSVTRMNNELKDIQGGESVFTLYLAVDIDQGYFKDVCSEHFFYTPETTGLSTLDSSVLKKLHACKTPADLEKIKDKVKTYIEDFFQLNTFEISIPSLRDPALAPKGKTALVISTLFDYHLCTQFKDLGWYDDFKAYAEKCIINTLSHSIYPDMDKKIIDKFSSTPLSMEKWTSNLHGALTGWAFTNKKIPVVHKITDMFDAVDTPLPHIYQAGQWTYCPAGFPIAMFTGKKAVDKVLKRLKKKV